MKIAIIHDWLVTMRGGEKVLEALCEVFPKASLYTLIYDSKKISPIIKNRNIYTSSLQSIPFIKKHFRYFLPLFPKLIESFDLKNYDLIISSSHCVAKGVKTSSSTLHISYVYSPIRYAWELFPVYFERYNKFLLLIIRLLTERIKKWDIYSTKRANYLIACSKYTALKIKLYYGRESSVIYPPVDSDFFTPEDIDENFYLLVSALTPYKKIDLAIHTFNQLKLPLVIIGEGSEMKYLKSIAKRNITFLGWQEKNILKQFLTRCKALIFPAQEDFGITSLEAQACGRPVIAYRKGGLQETIKENITGILFDEQKVDDLKRAILKFQKMQFDKGILRNHSLKFSRQIFKEKIKKIIEEKTHDYWSRN